jgi:hypothetical protein
MYVGGCNQYCGGTRLTPKALTMTSDEAGAHLSKTGLRPGFPLDFEIKWKKTATVFTHHVLTATLKYSHADGGAPTYKATVVLGKIIENCIEDPFSRFVFWLTADLNIEKTRLDIKARRAIRAELAKTIKPPTELQITEMNKRMNSLPDYLRVFYLEDYFDSVTKSL